MRKLLLRIWKKISRMGLTKSLPDKLYLKIRFYLEMGKKLDLKNPQTYNEKIQWLKINDRQQRYINLVDKLSAKEAVGEIIGKEYIVPTLFKWKSAEEIDFSVLPDKCILKCNHDQGSTRIFERGSSDEGEFRNHFKRRLKRNAFTTTREWPYKNIAPMILCEPYLCDDIIDYKIFCFNTKPGMINIGQKTVEDNITNVTFLDLNWEKMPFQRSDYSPVKTLPQKPGKIEEILELAEKLAQGTDFVRVDFFCIEDKIYFSEFTLYPTSGYIKFNPVDGDRILGEKIKLARR